ncbi:MAG: sigma-70 family RNA polymerase sigma factor [bacterium]|nr:sigma-70 family RNA polymerase sigma factor [bacterium]
MRDTDPTDPTDPSARETFEEHYRDVAPALYGWAYLRVGRDLRTQIDATDLVQETSLRALQGFERFDPDRGPFRRWVFRIAKNVLSEALRRSSFAAKKGDTGAWSAGQMPESVTRITTRIARDDALQVLLNKIEESDPSDQELFLRCGLVGESFVEAGRRMGLEPDAARMRWNRLRERLRGSAWVAELLATTD